MSRPVFIPISKTTKRPTSAAKGFSQPGYQGVEFGDHVALRLEGYAVIDCDTMEAAKAWRGAEGTETPFVVVTARGMHFYYRAVAGYKSNTTEFGDIDLKTGIGSYVMAPGAKFAAAEPGQHRPNESFGAYTPVGDLTELPEPSELPPLPVLALEGFRVQHDRSSYDGPDGWDEVPDGAGHGTMLSIAGSLRNVGMSSDTIHQVLDAINEIIMPSDPMSPEKVQHYVDSARSWEPGDTPNTPEPEQEPGTTKRLRTVTFDERPMELATWLWTNRIPAGELTIIAGKPGVGKSTTLLDNAAALTRGTLPGVYFGVPQHVLITATEDSFAHVIIPRFRAAGGDPKLIHEIIFNDDGSLKLPDDITDLKLITEQFEAKLLIVDPIISKVDGDTNNNTDVRKSLEPLAALAHATGLAVVGIMHFNKSGSTDPHQLLTGSSAFSEVPRSGLMALADPEDEGQYLLTQWKNSFEDKARTLRYTIEGREVGKVDAGTITASKIVWGDGDDDRTAIEVLQSTTVRDGEKKESKLAAAKQWVLNYLHNRPAMKSEVLQQGIAAGHAPSTIEKAAKLIPVVSQVCVSGGPAEWRLPANPEEIVSGGNTHDE